MVTPHDNPVPVVNQTAISAHDPANQSHEGMHGVEHHTDEHVIVPWQVLTGVLGALLFFTLLTVGVAKGEQWVAATWDLHLPTWLNVALAMSIATVKAALVCMYFMQLRYDKPLNTFVLLFCLVGVGLFLSLSAIDLGNRDSVEAWKAGEIEQGGVGTAISRPRMLGGGALQAGLVADARARAIAREPTDGGYHAGALYAFGGDVQSYWFHYYEYAFEKTHEIPTQHPDDDTDAYQEFLSHHLGAHPPELGTTEQRRLAPRVGLTPGLFGTPAAPAHGHGGGGHGADGHGADTQGAEDAHPAGDDHAENEHPEDAATPPAAH